MLPIHQVGNLILHKERSWRVLRKVRSESLFEDDNKLYLVEEVYLELRNAENETDFYVLHVKRTPWTGSKSPIRGLQPILMLEKEIKAKYGN